MQIFYPVSVWKEICCRSERPDWRSLQVVSMQLFLWGDIRSVFRYEARWISGCSSSSWNSSSASAAVGLTLLCSDRPRDTSRVSFFLLNFPFSSSLSVMFFFIFLFVSVCMFTYIYIYIYISLCLFDIHPFVRLYLLLIISISFCQSFVFLSPVPFFFF